MMRTLLSVLACTVLLAGCASAQDRVDRVALPNFLLKESELPEGFDITPITGQDLANSAEGHLTPSKAKCVEPTKLWWNADAIPSQRVGEYVEHPDAGVVIAVILGRPEGDVAVVEDYIDHCSSFYREGDGFRVKVAVTPWQGPYLEGATTVGYQEQLTLPSSWPVSSTYLLATVKGVSVMVVLRSKTREPTKVQRASLQAIFRGQVLKIAETGA